MIPHEAHVSSRPRGQTRTVTLRCHGVDFDEKQFPKTSEGIAAMHVWVKEIMDPHIEECIKDE